MSALKDRYQEQIIPSLKKELGIENIMQVPRLEKVVVNIGVGDGAQNAKMIDAVVDELTRIVGQKPVITRSKKSIAGFKVRENMPIGVKVTLRGERMYDFIAKLTSIVLPRIRDFRGISPKGFDGRGNFNLGLKDQIVFPEIDYDKIQKLRGMNITLVTSATDDRGARALMEHLGFPFQKAKAEKPLAEAKAS